MEPFEPPSTTLVKGIGLDAAMTYAEVEFGEAAVAEALGRLEGEFGSFTHHRLPGALVPLEVAASAWMAVAELHPGNVEERHAFFRKMGVFIADTNLNGIYKSLMALLANPDRLSKRIPQLWTTYFRGLEIELDLSEVKSGRVLHEVRGFGGAPHIGEMAEGWLVYAFELVGGRDVVTFEKRLQSGAQQV